MRDDRDYLDYFKSLSKEEQEYVIQFYNEFHNGAFYNKNTPLIKSQEGRKEAIRNNNMKQSDMLWVGRKRNSVEVIDENEFMHDACDEWDWENAYKQGGYELAVKTVMNQTIDEILNSTVEYETLLSRFYIKMDKLRRHRIREERKR